MIRELPLEISFFFLWNGQKFKCLSNISIIRRGRKEKKKKKSGLAIDCCWKHDSTNSQSGHIYTSLTCIWNIMVIIITRISFSIFAFWVSLSDTYGPPLLAQPSLYFSSCNESWSSIYSASSILNYTFKVRLHASCRSSSSSSHQ